MCHPQMSTSNTYFESFGAEYEALIHVLLIFVSLGIKTLVVYDDFIAVINQVNKEYDCTKESMDAYSLEVSKLEKHFHGLELHHVPRDQNIAPDASYTLVR